MLAIFDLDDTLIDGDSSSLWLRYLVQQGWASADMLPREAELMAAYYRGELEMDDYMSFTLQPLVGRTVEEVDALAASFIAERIAPIVFPDARAALLHHRGRGHTLLVISATGEHLVAPIARMLGADDSLAITLETQDGRYTGRTQGVLTYQRGKVERLTHWLENHGKSLIGSHGYSDSINDAPLLETVETAYTINADEKLGALADARGWRRFSWSR